MNPTRSEKVSSSPRMGISDRRHQSSLICCLLQLLSEIVPNLREVARILYLLTSKGLKFTWTEEHEKAFLTLKIRLLEAPILVFPNFELPFIIDTDASDTALSAVLSQVIDGIEYPIAFESRVLTKTEVSYATTKREALGVVQAVQWFRPYIYGSKCIIRMIMQVFNGCLGKMRME